MLNRYIVDMIFLYLNTHLANMFFESSCTKHELNLEMGSLTANLTSEN